MRQVIFRLLGTVSLAGLALPAQAADFVTYSWTTTSQGFGLNLGQPSAASFQVDLATVQTGKFSQSDIVNINLAYAGLSFDAFTASSGGLDNAAYVDATTGALIFNNNQQGLSVAGYQGGLFSDSFLSITIDNSFTPLGVALTSVSDQFNALKNGGAFAGFPTAGFWTATLPVVAPPPAVPEPATWAMTIAGFGLAGCALRSRRRQSVRVTYA